MRQILIWAFIKNMPAPLFWLLLPGTQHCCTAAGVAASCRAYGALVGRGLLHALGGIAGGVAPAPRRAGAAIGVVGDHRRRADVGPVRLRR